MFPLQPHGFGEVTATVDDSVLVGVTSVLVVDVDSVVVDVISVVEQGSQ